MHRPHAVGRAHRDGTQRRAREDQEPGDTEANEDERRARGREHALQREGDDGAEVSARISELVERRAPVGGPERELEDAGRGDREECERECEPQALDGRVASDERDADDDEGDRHGQAHPTDEQPDALAERLADDARPVGVDAEAGDERDEQAREPGEVSLVAVDRLAPPGPSRGGRARALRRLGARLRLLAGDHSSHNANSSNISNTGVAWAPAGEPCSGHEMDERRFQRARP